MAWSQLFLIQQKKEALIPRLVVDWILPFIQTNSNHDFDSIMIRPLYCNRN